MKTLSKVRKETKGVLREKRIGIMQNYKMGLLTVGEYSNLLGVNLKMINSTL